MGEDQAALQCGVGVHRRRVLHLVHCRVEQAEAHGTYRVGKALPLTGDVGHLELELSSGKPGVGSLGPKLTELDFARPVLLL